MPSDAPHFPVLEAADGYDISAVDQHVWTLLAEIRKGRETGFHPGPLDTRPFRLVHANQVYDRFAVDEWLDRRSGELEARRQHPSSSRSIHESSYEGDLDDPPELRGAYDPEPTSQAPQSPFPLWARIVALLVIVGLLGLYVMSYF